MRWHLAWKPDSLWKTCPILTYWKKFKIVQSSYACIQQEVLTAKFGCGPESKRQNCSSLKYNSCRLANEVKKLNTALHNCTEEGGRLRTVIADQTAESNM